MVDKDVGLMAHLMRRAGFGALREELESRVAKGYEATVEELLDPASHGIPSFHEGILFRHFHGFKNPGNPINMQASWMYRMINTPRPLEEKMVLFWHQVFATGVHQRREVPLYIWKGGRRRGRADEALGHRYRQPR